MPKDHPLRLSHIAIQKTFWINLRVHGKDRNLQKK